MDGWIDIWLTATKSKMTRVRKLWYMKRICCICARESAVLCCVCI